MGAYRAGVVGLLLKKLFPDHRIYTEIKGKIRTPVFSDRKKRGWVDVLWGRIVTYSECNVLPISPSWPVTQGYCVVPSEDRFLLLFTFLKRNTNKKIIVFFSSCNSVKFHAELFNYIQVPVLELHVGGGGLVLYPVTGICLDLFAMWSLRNIGQDLSRALYMKSLGNQVNIHRATIGNIIILPRPRYTLLGVRPPPWKYLLFLLIEKATIFIKSPPLFFSKFLIVAGKAEAAEADQHLLRVL